MVRAPASRVPAQTDEEITRQIRRRAENSVLYHVERPHEIDARLRELDEEWDIERVLDANAVSVSLIGLTISLTAGLGWLILPVAVAGFLLQHAVQVWCPPLPVFRRLGYRTADEIAEERYVLKVLRGDFAPVADTSGSAQSRAWRALEAVYVQRGCSEITDPAVAI